MQTGDSGYFAGRGDCALPFIDAGDDGMGSLRRYGNPADWLAFHALLAKKETVPEGKALSTQFVCRRERDGRIVFRSATS